MKIGIIGSGNMGRALGTRLANLGHEVFFGARSIEKALEAAAESRGRAGGGNVDEAAAFGDVLIWTIRETDPTKALRKIGVLSGKIIVDLGNRDYSQEVRTGAWFEKSLGEKLQENVPGGAKVVKAFNTLAMEAFDTDPGELRAAGAQTFLAGNDVAAKRTAGEIANEFGIEAVDLGTGPAAMRAAEALGDVIRLLMIDGKQGGRAHLKLIALPEPKLGQIGERKASNYA